MVPANAQRSKHRIKDRTFFFFIEFRKVFSRLFPIQQHLRLCCWRAIRCNCIPSRIHTAPGRCLQLTTYWLQIRIHARSRPVQYGLSLKDKMGILSSEQLHCSAHKSTEYCNLKYSNLVCSWKRWLLVTRYSLLYCWFKKKCLHLWIIINYFVYIWALKKSHKGDWITGSDFIYCTPILFFLPFFFRMFNDSIAHKMQG